MKHIKFLFIGLFAIALFACEKEVIEPIAEPIEEEVNFRGVACTDAGVYKAGANLLYAFCEDGTFIRVLDYWGTYYEHGTTLGEWELLPSGNLFLDYYSAWTTDREYYDWTSNEFGIVWKYTGSTYKTLYPKTVETVE